MASHSKPLHESLHTPLHEQPRSLRTPEPPPRPFAVPLTHDLHQPLHRELHRRPAGVRRHD